MRFMVDIPTLDKIKLMSLKIDLIYIIGSEDSETASSSAL